MNKHILTNGMETNYTRWIYPGEDFDADVIEHPVDVHDTEDGDNGADDLKRCLKTYAQQ